MGILKKLREAGGAIKTETKQGWKDLKEQYPKAKENVRRARVVAGKFAKDAKKAHAEGRKTIRSFSESLPKVPDDYFDQFLGAGSTQKKKKRKRKPKKKVVYYY